ncbi:MAG: tetratricopeptide repeat protein, partial [Thermoguttaceae bacterium]
MPRPLRETLLRYAPAAMIVVAGLLAYSNAFSAPFVFDGVKFVRDSPAIRQLWPPTRFLRSNRPVGQLSFALNYAVHGTDVWGYHAVNVGIHLAAGLLLFGIVRRTLQMQPMFTATADDRRQLGPKRRRSQEDGPASAGWSTATWLALAATLVWTLHPLQTQSVTYLYQRYESLMGMLVLASVYAFIRGAQAREGRFWYAAGAACCLLAMGTKETAAVVPLVLLWYDRAFLADSWREVARRRGLLHGPLLAVLAGGIVYVAWNQAWYAGGGVLAYEKVSTLEYARSQPGVILHYLRLAFWPAGQCLDYGWPVAQTPWQIVPPLLAIGVMLGLTAWAAWRRPALGFLGGWFFLFLAPTSSFAPIIDLAFEHRMYLPLAAVAVPAVLGFYRLAEWTLKSPRWAVRERQAFCTVVLGAAVVALAVTTHRRNEVYQSEATAWLDVVEKAPQNARGHYNLAHALEDVGDFDRARRHYRRAVELDPDDAVSHSNLANILAQVDGDVESAIEHYHRAIAVAPEYAAARANLGAVLGQLGRTEEAMTHC